MSNWTMDEVNELTDKQGGGNAAALHTWLQKAPRCGQKYPGGARPKEGDRVEIFKQFVMDTYEYGKFRADTPYQPGAAPTSSVPSSVSSTPAVTSAPGSALKRANSHQSDSGRTANLLDDDSNFGDFSSVPPPAAPAQHQKVTSPFDPFGTSNGHSFDPFTSPSRPHHNAHSHSNHSASAAPHPPPPVVAPPSQVKKPAAAPSLMDFSDTTATTTVHTSSASSFAADFADFSFSPPRSPVPAGQQQQQQQQNDDFSSFKAAPAFPQQQQESSPFDPFGADLLTPNNSGKHNAAPQQGQGQQQQQSQAPANPFRPSPQQPAPQPQNNILDLFTGLSFDANSNTNNNRQSGMMQPQQTNNNYMGSRPSNSSSMMNSSSAISSIDVFGANNAVNSYQYGNNGNTNNNNNQRNGGAVGNATGMNSSYSNMSNNGRWNNGASPVPVPPPHPFRQSPMMGAAGMNPHGGMNATNHMNMNNMSNNMNNNGSGAGGGNNFDFLQETMKKHLSDPSYQNNRR
jgi:hypothetical protein